MTRGDGVPAGCTLHVTYLLLGLVGGAPAQDWGGDTARLIVPRGARDGGGVLRFPIAAST